MNNTNPYLQNMPQDQNDPAQLFRSLLNSAHSFNIGPVRIDCDLDPSDGIMGMTCYFFGQKIMERQITVHDNTASCEGVMGPARVQLQFTGDFAAHCVDYQMTMCMLNQCQKVGGRLGGWTAPQPVPA